MLKVLLVDDEILALNYFRGLISWEENGFEVAGCARSARAALELYEKERPEIVISDIRMPGMDGLELAVKLKEKNPDVIVVLLSAYRDFEYAQKGIQYGVHNYLLKHELCQEKLLDELNRIRRTLQERDRQKRIYYKYFAKQLISSQDEAQEMQDFGNRFFLLLIHKNDLYENGVFREDAWTAEEMRLLISLLEDGCENVEFVAEESLSTNNLLALYRIGQISSRREVAGRIEQISRRIGARLAALKACDFNLIFSGEIARNEISVTFRRMSCQIRYAPFLKERRAYAMSEISLPDDQMKMLWKDSEKELRNRILRGQDADAYLDSLFESVKTPVYHLRGLKDLLYMLDNLAAELEESGGISAGTADGLHKVDAVRQYYRERFEGIRIKLQELADQKYSRLVQDMIRYMHRHYCEELGLEQMGEIFQMNGVYLGQVFRRETGVTFLKYLTNLRIEEAKRLLQAGDRNISQVAECVGYKTSQYFSQIFFKMTGVKPQEYRRWKQDM